MSKFHHDLREMAKIESHSLRQQVLSTEKIRRPFPQNARNMPVFRIFVRQHGLERTDCSGSNSANVLAYLWMANAQSGFKDRIRRMQCDQNPGLRASRVDFCQQVGHWFEASYKPVSG